MLKISKPKKITVSISFTEELVKLLDKERTKAAMTRSEFAESALRIYLEEATKGRAK